MENQPHNGTYKTKKFVPVQLNFVLENNRKISIKKYTVDFANSFIYNTIGQLTNMNTLKLPSFMTTKNFNF